MVELRRTQHAPAQAKGAALVDALLARAWQAGHADPWQNTCILVLAGMVPNHTFAWSRQTV